MIRRIGLDIGGVITDRLKNDETDTACHGDNFMQTTAVPGVFEAIYRLVEYCGRDNVFIVSTCGLEIQERSLLWLEGNDFYATTGLWREHVYFCLARSEKAPIAAHLGLTYFVDDHPEVLEPMADVVEHRLLFGPQPEELVVPSGIIAVSTWAAALDVILG